MTPPVTRVLPLSEESLAEAARLVLAGEPVAVPTETVYGLAADATDGDAVARIYAAKGRPGFNPLIVHVADLAAAEALALFSDEVRALAEEHWPGPLTLVLPARPDNGIAALVTAGLDTIAIRVPAHTGMRALLEATGRPLAAPSANISGRISPTRAEHVVRTLGGRIGLVIDGGPTERGIESTIVAATGGPLRLLRRGPVEVRHALAVEQGAIEAPGMMASHYAPSKPLRLDTTEARTGELLIGYGPIPGDLYLGEDALTAASRLFDLLHQADERECDSIAVAPIPGDGLAAAIRDRLRRAAAPRPRADRISS
jgi:L-threonylcarbamoyladenylate synthase